MYGESRNEKVVPTIPEKGKYANAMMKKINHLQSEATLKNSDDALGAMVKHSAIRYGDMLKGDLHGLGSKKNTVRDLIKMLKGLSPFHDCITTMQSGRYDVAFEICLLDAWGTAAFVSKVIKTASMPIIHTLRENRRINGYTLYRLRDLTTIGRAAGGYLDPTFGIGFTAANKVLESTTNALHVPILKDTELK